MTPITCPACKKSGLTTDACPRCGCDLRRLHEVNRASLWLLSKAVRSLEEGQWPDALDRATHSWKLRHSASAARIAFLAAGALELTDQAVRWQSCAAKQLI